MALKDIKDIDKNMQENISSSETTDKWIEINSEIIDNYMMGKAIKTGNFNRLNDTYVSDNVETLKLQPAGLNICFSTNSKYIKLKASLAGASYMSHMTAVGTIGFSLYVENNGKWNYLSCTKINQKEYEVKLIDDINHEHNYRLYFPLYQVLNNVSLGISNNSYLNFYKLNEPTLLIYGTSISQGGCASRPGMDYGAILGRMNNLNVINLGFSGSCKVEREVLDIINQAIDEQDIKYLIFELESNSPSYDHMKERFSYYLENLHNKENIKIYLVSHFDEALIFVNDKINKYRKGFKKVQKELCDKYNINFIDGVKITKNINCEGTVDGVHPNDLGFYEIAKNFSKILNK